MCGRQNNAPPEDVCVRIPRAREYIIWQRGIRYADGIKVANHLTLNVGRLSGIITVDPM